MKLIWTEHDTTTDGRFTLQREHSHNEPVCWYLFTEVIPQDVARAYLATREFDCIAWGPGAKQKVKAEIQRFADWLDGS